MLEMLYTTQLMFLTCQRKTSFNLLDVLCCKFNKMLPKIQLFCVVYCCCCRLIVVHVMMVKTDRKNRMLESWDEIIEDEDEVTEE